MHNSVEHQPPARTTLAGRRRRGHLAVLAIVMAAVAVCYFMLPSRTVRVIADGRQVIIDTHQPHDLSALHRAGVELQRGDRLTELRGNSADVLQVERARQVILTVDGRSYVLTTHAATVRQALDEAAIQTDDRDSVLLNGVFIPANAPLAQAASVDREVPITVEVRRAVSFKVLEGARSFSSTSSRPTIAQALREAGVVVGPGDRVTPDEESNLADGTTIEVSHAAPVTLTLPGEHRVLYTFDRTVGDLLRDEGVALPVGAFVDPPEDTPIEPNMSVRVVQLASSNEIEREFIESKTVYREDASLAPGATRTVPGRDGARVRRYDISYVDGEEVSRQLVDEYYDPEPADTVIYFAPRSNVAGPPAGAARTLTVYATWYNAASSGRPASDPNYGITATGVRVTYGIVAVDPSIIPLGTRLYIPGYGEAIAADTGGAVKGYIIDLGFPDGVESPWQPKWVEIYVLD